MQVPNLNFILRGQKGLKLRLKKLDPNQGASSFFIYVLVFQIFLEKFIAYGLSEIGFLRLVFSLLFWAAILYHFFRTIKQLYYSFFGLSIFILLGAIFSILEDGSFSLTSPMFFLNLLIILNMVVVLYLYSTPLYYPKISNWNKEHGGVDGPKVYVYQWSDRSWTEGRIFDFRRMAAGLISFSEFEQGKRYLLKTHNPSLLSNEGKTTKVGAHEFQLEFRVFSKRPYSFGRGNLYGIKILKSANSESYIRSVIKYGAMAATIFFALF